MIVDSQLIVVARLRVGHPGERGSISGRNRIFLFCTVFRFSILHSVPTGSRSRVAFYPVSTKVPFSGGKAAGA
jgi:hypothetical protein